LRKDVVRLNRYELTKSIDPIINTGLKQLLEAENKENLIQLLLSMAADSDVVEKRIHLHLSKAGGIEELEECRKLIRSYVDIYADDHGFVNWRNVNKAVEGAEIAAEKACAAFDNSEWVRAVEIYLTIVEEMIDLLHAADDSSGRVGGVIEESLARIREVTMQADRISQTDRNRIFQLLLEGSKQSRYKGWTDWQLALLEMASHLALTADFRQKWQQHAAELYVEQGGDTSSNNYFDEKVALMRYHLIRSYDGNDQACDFLSRHLYFSSFREMAIRDALQNDCFEEVIRLTEEGEAQDQAKGLRGLVSGWKKYRYEAYSRSSQIELQRKLGVELILDGEFSYYKPVKNLYPPDEWTLVYGDMRQKLENNQRPGKIYTLILVEEKEYTRLLAHIRKQPSSIEEFHSLLYPYYPQEVKSLFLAYIETKAERSANRKDYADVCRIIRMLQKAGGKEEALQVVRLLLAKYPKKPAFQDELMKI
jgi:hypothetical protein